MKRQTDRQTDRKTNRMTEREERQKEKRKLINRGSMQSRSTNKTEIKKQN